MAPVAPTMVTAQTMGLILHTPAAFDGYTLFEGLTYTDTYLIDLEGRLVHSWHSLYEPGDMAYLLENGHLIRGANPGSNWFQQGGAAGIIEEFDWDGNPVWSYTYSDSLKRHHHDLAVLPNGNVLMLAWELKNSVEAIAAGRDPGKIWDGAIWPEHILEIEPTGANGGAVVWEWYSWDHLIQDFDSTAANFGVVADHPELIDINYTHNGTGGADWMHANALNYNEDLDQIAISVNQFSEFWIIDHGTSTAEAAGHSGGARGKGGDLLYRWGNPQTYDRGTAADRKLYRQHDVQWIPNGRPGSGNILLFNNGFDRPEGAYSSVEEIQTTADGLGDYPDPLPGQPHGPATTVWTYTSTPPEDLYGPFISGAERLPNGNTLICDGAPSGTFHEVDATDSLAWMYISPVGTNGPLVQGTTPTSNLVFRARRYAPTYAAFDGRDLTPGDVIELPATTAVPMIVAGPAFELYPSYPNPARFGTTISFSLERAGHVRLDVFDVAGRHVATLVDGVKSAGSHRQRWDAFVASGVYHYRLGVDGASETGRVLVLR
ncbi:MAG: thioredoxin [Gemmatimonadota bacterium]|nr:MAG: thioredoxin [Gemmatimonadota bacterium]